MARLCCRRCGRLLPVVDRCRGLCHWCEPASAAQRRLMHALFHEAGISQRADRLAVTSAIAGHAVETSNDLDRVEISRVIDYLARALRDTEGRRGADCTP
jgi:hypothetical protein